MHNNIHIEPNKGNKSNSLTCPVCGNELIVSYLKVIDTLTKEDFAVY